MKVSNKLSREDFIKLQEILLEDYKPGKVIQFMLRYITSIMYGFIIFMFIYLLGDKYLKENKLIVSIILGILVAIIMIIIQPKLFKKKAKRMITRMYNKDDSLDFVRSAEFTDNEIILSDDKGENKVEFSSIRKVIIDSNAFFVIYDTNSGYVFRVNDEEKVNVKNIFINKKIEVIENAK